MKKILLLSIFVGATHLTAGSGNSKPSKPSNQHSALSSVMQEQTPKQTTETPNPSSKPKPFGGKSWNGVYIRSDDDHSIYVINDRLTKWDFRGFEPTDCEYDSKDAKVVFTDDACYARNRDTVVKYPMNGGSKKTTVMKNMIKRITASQTGFATLTDDGFITLFDTNGNPEGSPIKVDPADTIIRLLDTGELFHIHSKQTIALIDPNTKKQTDVITLENSPTKISRKKTSNGHIIVACKHQTVKDGATIHLVDVENGNIVLSIPTSSYPNQWDLEGNNLATGGNGRTVKLFDITTVQKTYEEDVPL